MFRNYWRHKKAAANKAAGMSNVKSAKMLGVSACRIAQMLSKLDKHEKKMCAQAIQSISRLCDVLYSKLALATTVFNHADTISNLTSERYELLSLLTAQQMIEKAKS